MENNDSNNQRPGTTRIALYVVGVIVAALCFIGAYLSWKYGDRELAGLVVADLKVLALIVLAFYFGRETAK